MASSSPRRSENTTKVQKPSKKGKSNQAKPKFSRPLKVLVINFGSIKNKVADLAVCVDQHNPDIILGSETWINPSIKSEELFPDKYTVVRKDREDSYGGVVVAIKKDLVGTHKIELDTNCEIVWVEIQLVGNCWCLLQDTRQ